MTNTIKEINKAVRSVGKKVSGTIIEDIVCLIALPILIPMIFFNELSKK